MKLHEAARQLRTQLEAIYDPQEAGNIAALVLEDIGGFSPAERPAHENLVLDDAQRARLDDCAARLLRHEPVQYVLQKAWFYGLELYVNPDVLIPRPETEELVYWIVQDVKAAGLPVFERAPQQADVTTELKIMDVGTGSGCIALALKKTMPLAEVWGCDKSDSALTVARRNGSTLDIRVDFQSVDFLDAAQQKHLPTVDIIVSNPPYIPESGRAEMAPNVVEHEPHGALFVPDTDALLFYRALASFGHARLHAGGALYMEVHEDHAQEVAQLFEAEGYRDVTIKKDMQGKDRMVKAHAAGD